MKSAEVESLLAELKLVQTMGELDYLRIPIVEATIKQKVDESIFHEVQRAFISAKNRLERIPWAQRRSDWYDPKSIKK